MAALHEGEQLSRDMGIDLLGKMPWGTHLCLFYETKDDLIDILVPYFKAGLQNNEFCMWITCDPLSEQQAKRAMEEAVPNFDEHLDKGQIEILAHTDWYLEQGVFDALRVFEQWMDKLDEALTNGYAGIRVSGNSAWLDQRTWPNFIEYEHALNDTIAKYQMLVVCAYRLDGCKPSKLIDSANNHQLALMKQDGRWTLVKNAERKRADLKSLEYQLQLKSLASELALTEEQERRRIASELDSRVSQSLAASKSKLDMLSRSVAGTALHKALSEISRSLGSMIADTASLSFDLSSPLLHDLGFEAAVAQWLYDEIEKKSGIETEFRDDGQTKPLDDDVRILVFRDVRELLGNVARHSHATKVKVSIDRVDRRIRIVIEDDGVGFDPVEVASQAAARSEFGLFGIQAKLGHLAGHLEIKSAPGCGCKVTIIAPLKREKATDEY